MDFLKFLQYHNAVPIAISIAFLGAGGAFAATNPEAVFSVQKSVLSVDNTYLVNKDLSTYTPHVQIHGVTEDEHTYYVSYTLSTIGLEDHVWKDVTRQETMNVTKESLGQYGDLGLFVTAQLKQIVDRELAGLQETQGIERKHITQKTVATAYGGLVGALLDNTVEEIPGYVPVVTPPPPPVPEPLAQQQWAPQEQVGGGSAAPSAGNLAGLQVLGNNPAQLNLRDSYVDLGVAITNIEYANFGVHVQVDGVPSEQVVIDTTAAGTHTVRYMLTDGGGAMSVAERQIIIIGNPDAEPAQSSQEATTTMDNQTPTSTIVAQ